MERISDEEIMILSDAIDEMDYYQILKVEPSASAAEIKQAYYNSTRIFHPDNFVNITDAEIKQAIMKISKLITEAYVVLRDFDKRKRYDAQISKIGAERRIRYVEDEAKEEQKEDIVSPQAKRLYLQAISDLKQNRTQDALKNLKLALAFEPGSKTIRDKIEEIQIQKN